MNLVPESEVEGGLADPDTILCEECNEALTPSEAERGWRLCNRCRAQRRRT